MRTQKEKIHKLKNFLDAGDFASADVVHAAGVDIHEPSGPDGLTITAEYAEAKNHQAIDWLIQKGADATTVCRRGRNAIWHAVKANDAIMVRKLLSATGNRGANSQNGDGVSALLYAVRSNNVEIAKMLLDAGANPGHKDRFGGNPQMEVQTGTVRKNAEMRKLFNLPPLESGEL
jgi:ankyrin repeat protein